LPGRLRSLESPASRSWPGVTACLFHSRHQGCLRADGRNLRPEQVWLDGPDQTRRVASRNVHRCLTSDRNAQYLFHAVSLSWVYLHSPLCTVCAVLLLQRFSPGDEVLLGGSLTISL